MLVEASKIQDCFPGVELGEAFHHHHLTTIYTLSTDCILSRLLGWHIALITIGAIALIVGIVLTITGIVFSSKEVGEFKCLLSM